MSTMLAHDFVLDLLRDLIAIRSVNPTLAPVEGNGEAEIAAFAASWLNAHGVRARVEPVAPGRENVYAEIGDGSGPTLCFCAHLDTVGTEGMTIPPFEPRVEGNRVYGRGSFDMKGGLAAVMAAAAEIARTGGLPGKLTLALVADEEYASIGAADFVRRHPADGCILTEASAQQLILGHKGFVWAEVKTTGHAAHGSRWDLGVSAIGKMGRIIAALERYDREVLRARVHPLVGPASMHCAMVSGGTGLSTYAPECSLKVECRTLPGDQPQQVIQELIRVIHDAGEEATVQQIFDRPPLLCDRNERVAEQLRAAARAVTGETPAETGVGYWMDAALFAAAGIPAVNYGPDGAGAHEAVEWVDLDSVLSVTQVLTEAARRFCR